MKKIKIHPLAEEELLNSSLYYESKAKGLGQRFLHEFEIGIQNIIQYPEAWPVLTETIRKYILNKFPYGIIYIEKQDFIYILSVMHLARKPFYWKDRNKE